MAAGNGTLIDVRDSKPADTQSMTTFKRNSAGALKRIRRTGRPLLLTIRGKAEAVVMEAGAWQKMADHVNSMESIRRGLSEAKMGLGRPLDDVFDNLEQYA